MNTKYLTFFGVTVIVAAAIATISMMSTYANNELHLRTVVADSSVEKRLGDILNSMNNFPGSAGKDMIFLRSLSSLSGVGNNDNDSLIAQNDLQLFVNQNEAYSAFFVFRDNVEEIGVYGHNVSDGCEGISDEAVKAASVTQNVSIGEVYISPLSAISCPGLELPVSAILYSTKVMEEEGHSVLMVGVVNADYFLEDVRRLSRDNERVYLVQSDGAYLANSDRLKEWVNDKDSNLYIDYPGLPSGVLTDSEIKHFDNGDNRFTFMRIVPSMSNFVLYDGSLDSSNDNNNYWVLVAVSNEKLSWWGSAYGYMFMILGSIVLYGLLAWAFILMRSLSGSRSK